MKSKKLIAIVIAATICTIGSSNFKSASGIVKADTNDSNGKTYSELRLGGTDRYDTSSQIANEFLKSGNNNGIILALGTNFPDALSGSVLSKKCNAPILLVNPNNYPAIISYIQKNITSDKKVYLLGGTGGISQDLEDKLNSLGYNNIVRLGGQDRFETNVKIVNELDVKEETPVVVANGDNFPDALSISAIASSKGYPILIIKNNSISDAVKQQLSKIKPSKVYIIGGTGVVSDASLSEIQNSSGVSSDNIIRIGGANRYDTSLQIAKYFNQDSDTIAFASGINFPDALSGSALAAQQSAPLVLVNDSNISEVKEYVNSSKYTKEIFFGGNGVIKDSLVTYLLKSVLPPAEPSDPIQQGSVIRLGGKDRYDTAVMSSRYGWPSANTIFLAGAQNDDEFADAIAGTPLAHSMDAPILLTKHDALPDIVANEITRLSPKNIVILGGTGVVSQNIEDGLTAKGYSISRIAGKDRYDTAIQIAKQLWAKYPSTNEQVGSDHAVLLTTGKQFQYAMSVASTAGNTAILFSDGDSLNSSVSSLLSSDKNLQSINVIGGNKILGVNGNLYKSNPSLFYIDNYNNVSDLEKGEGFLQNYIGVSVASDKAFPDALAGSALTAKMGYKMVLSDGSSFPYTVDDIQNKLSGGLIFGGIGSIDDSMFDKIKAILNKNIPSNPDGLKDTDLVPFTDDGFKRDAQKVMGKTDITLGDAKGLLNLTLNDNNNLADLKYFPNLMALTINGGTVNNIDSLANLYDLSYLHLNNCTYDLASLKSLKNVIIVADGQIISRGN